MSEAGSALRPISRGAVAIQLLQGRLVMTVAAALGPTKGCTLLTLRSLLRDRDNGLLETFMHTRELDIIARLRRCPRC